MRGGSARKPPMAALYATHERLEEAAMRASSLRQRHRSLSNVFLQGWRRWMAIRANLLLETACLGSDKLEYLTHDPGVSHSDLCTIARGRADDLLRRRMLALELDPYELARSDPALLRHLQSCLGG